MSSEGAYFLVAGLQAVKFLEYAIVFWHFNYFFLNDSVIRVRDVTILAVNLYLIFIFEYLVARVSECFLR